MRITENRLTALAGNGLTRGMAAFSKAARQLETGLSVLGLGVQAPYPSWGNIIADADSRPLAHWWLVLFPTAAIAVTVIAANTVAEGFARAARDASAPRPDEDDA